MKMSSNIIDTTTIVHTFPGASCTPGLTQRLQVYELTLLTPLQSKFYSNSLHFKGEVSNLPGSELPCPARSPASLPWVWTVDVQGTLGVSTSPRA